MDRIAFKVNGVDYSVGSEVTSDVMLLDYLRNVLELRGTKYMCRQAGCGACIVAAKKPGGDVAAVNSCMVSITSCQDWEIQTIEGLGNRKKGYHSIQKALADHNGSQCGHCSPGWAMSMYCLLYEKKNLTKLEIEKSFGSNVCRCTGYRPILEAFRTFAKSNIENPDIPDIEELNICKITDKPCSKSCSDDGDSYHCIKNQDNDEEWCVVTNSDCVDVPVKLVQLKDGRKWYRANSVRDINQLFQKEGIDSYMLVAGNTAKGAYPKAEYPRILIDINGVSELKTYVVDQNLVIGSGITLTKLLNIYKDISQKDNFAYLKEFYDHLQLVAHIAVRNLGTIGGNLMLKYQHNEFPSDLYLMFQTVGAGLTIINRQCKRQYVTMEQFLRTDMKGAIILNVKLPPLSDMTKVKTSKVMPRSQNAHAIVNFGGLYKFSANGLGLAQCRLVFGGLSAGYTIAKMTGAYLIEKTLFTNETLQAAVRMLDKELVVTEIPPEPSAAYRKKLAIGLFYRSLLSICPENILNKRYKSGAIKLHETRPVSQAKRSYETEPAIWPLTKPMPKIESLIQCAGEALYTEDIPSFPREVFGDLVLSTVAKGTLSSIDIEKALKCPGVIAVYTAKDIPGLNSFTPADNIEYSLNEEVLCSTEVRYYNQPIAIVVGETRHIAELATKLVIVNYKNIGKPVLDIKEAKKDENRLKLLKSIDSTNKGTDIFKVIKGSNTIYGQYHFTMETLACVVRPTEEGIEAYVTTQWADAVQTMIARALNMDGSKVDVHVRRVGGGYGIKISRSILIAVAASLVVTKLNRPCRFIQSMQTVSRAFGKRFPCSSDYEFAVNKSGVIQNANYKIFEDNGFTINEKLAEFGLNVYYNCYDKSRWDYKMFDVTTDTAKNTWFRGPGTLESLAMIEMIMEHISYELSADPVELRLANLDSKFDSIKEMLSIMITKSQYKERREQIQKFNKENRWKKRGFRFMPMKWTHNYSRYFDVNLSVYHVDGSVSIVHGGVEVGQGINTRAAQIAAYFLKIPLEKIQIKANSTIISPNAAVTGGSITATNIGIGVEKCCKELIKRLEPIKNKMNDPSWEDLIAKAFKEGTDLQTHGFVGPKDIQYYDVYGIAFAEVEIDVLTGELEVQRVDVMDDAGQSVTPEIDIGQVEGGFVMGLGYWTMEHLVYDKNTGELLTDRPWNYYVPQARDIPQDFRVYLRKKSYSSPAILGSKAVGEPPMCMAVAIPFAIREAVTAARQESGIPTTTWFPFVENATKRRPTSFVEFESTSSRSDTGSFDSVRLTTDLVTLDYKYHGPFTAESICLSASTNIDELKFY